MKVANKKEHKKLKRKKRNIKLAITIIDAI